MLQSQRQLLEISFIYTSLYYLFVTTYRITLRVIDLDTKLFTRINGRKRKLLIRKEKKATSTETKGVHNFDKLTLLSPLGDAMHLNTCMESIPT